MQCPKCKYIDPAHGAFECPSCGTSYLKVCKRYNIRDKDGKFKKMNLEEKQIDQ